MDCMASVDFMVDFCLQGSQQVTSVTSLHGNRCHHSTFSKDPIQRPHEITGSRYQ